MGAEAEELENKQGENPRSMTKAQFLAWKRQKVFFLFLFAKFLLL